MSRQGYYSSTSESRSTADSTRSGCRPGKCYCSWYPKLREAHTPENKGRKFWRCDKPRGEQCEYFYWDDEFPGPYSSVELETLQELVTTMERRLEKAENDSKTNAAYVKLLYLVVFVLLCVLLSK